MCSAQMIMKTLLIPDVLYQNVNLVILNWTYHHGGQTTQSITAPDRCYGTSLLILHVMQTISSTVPKNVNIGFMNQIIQLFPR